MASSNLNPRHRDGTTPQLQLHRRPSHSRPIGIPRIAVSASGTSFIATNSAGRPVTDDTALSTSAPDSLDTVPIRHSSLRPKDYGTPQVSQTSRVASSGGTASADSSKKPSASRPRRPSTSTLPTSSTHRPQNTRSFLLSPSTVGPNSGGKALGTMSPVPKHQRTSKTSQKLVVLPSAPQTKPLSKQLVLLDEEQESSDDAAHPHGILPPRRVIRKPISTKVATVRAKPDEEEERVIASLGEDSQQPLKMRIRDYKSSAERMSKEERQQAGYKRMTAYCIAEGLKMKVLAGFLKREHNVLPRVFDEALYVMYHLPLLPGYGPQTNVRSSAPPMAEASSTITGMGLRKSILTRLEEAEENGYQGSYFPQTQDLINLGESTNDGHRTSAPSGIDGFTTEDGGGPDTSAYSLPGWVQPAEVDEVREDDGYVTSSSLPRAEGGTLRSDVYPYEYNHYPTSSSALSTPSTLRKQDLTLQPSEQSDLEHVEDTSDKTMPNAEPTDSPPTPPSRNVFINPAESHYVDSGLETDDPGIQADPGVYGTSPTKRFKRVHFSGISAASSIGERHLLLDARDETGEEPEGEELVASGMTTVPSEPLMGNDSTAQSNSLDESASSPEMARANTPPILERVATHSDTPEILYDLLGQEDAQRNDTQVLSAYEIQLAYERERDQREELVELERERHRQLEYEQALEREQVRERERQLDNVGEAVFFDYGVVVFFGLTEREERDILDDIEQAGVMRRPISEEEFEVEECHFAHDPNISYPRIYNDFFTLKSRSHLLKLSIAHALAQSTLLARYETLAQRTLSSPLTMSIPRQLASSGSLQLRRHEALKLTGRLFKLRRDVNLVSNVLDVPELFWSEASLKDLYDAVREYMEIDPRVENLNEKLGVASDFLDAIHDHLNNNAMERITLIIIWLIVVAVLVELGEIIARLVVHAGLEKERTTVNAALAVCSMASSSKLQTIPLSKEEALRTLERIMNVQA